MSSFNIEKATHFLHEKMENKNLRKHCYAVGKCMAHFYDYWKEKGRNVGNLTKEDWEIVGILHDADYEHTKDTPEKHGPTVVSWLEQTDINPKIVEVLKTHNYKTAQFKKPETLCDWTLDCIDELTGFIVACALVQPEKNLDVLGAESIIKKFKKKEFARAVDRTQITQCEKVLNIPVEEFVTQTLKAMQDNAELLGF